MARYCNDLTVKKESNNHDKVWQCTRLCCHSHFSFLTVLCYGLSMTEGFVGVVFLRVKNIEFEN